MTNASEADLTKAHAYLTHLVKEIREKRPDASDIQFVGGDQIWIHENGADKRLGIPMDEQTVCMFADAVAHSRGGSKELLEGEKGTVEIAANIHDVRLRMTWRRQMGGVALNTRILPSEPPPITSPRYASNPIPETLVEMVLRNTTGLILVEGPTGSGKSTMLASLVHEINRTQQRHIYTIEDPIEFVHTSNQSLITQREVHTHTDSFFQGMQTAKRSKPGVILLGELRDNITKRAAIEAAGEGHLVLATSHANAVPEAISTFVGAFPSDEQNDVAQRLAVTLRGVICQQLIPSSDGRVVAVREMLTVDDLVADKLTSRETGQKLRGMLMSSEIASKVGNFSRDNDLLKLVQQGHITEATAYKYAIDRKELQAKVNAQKEKDMGL